MATPSNLLRQLLPIRIAHRPSCPAGMTGTCLCDHQERRQLLTALIDEERSES